MSLKRLRYNIVLTLATIALLMTSFFSVAQQAQTVPDAIASGELVECTDGNTNRFWWDSCPTELGWVALGSNTAPTISLSGASTVSYDTGDSYSELGATCSDTEDGSITVPAPSFSPALDMNTQGTYVATYTCTDSGFLTDQTTRNVVVTDPPPVSAALAFTNTSSSIVTSPDIDQVFWAGFVEVNGDGCMDIYIGSHEDAVNSNMQIQDNVGGVCQGTFTYFPDADNYSQASPTIPRITSRYMWGNWYGHPQGFWSFYGHDVDGSASARYVLDPAFTTVGGQPQFLTKSFGCFGERPKCIIADIDGGGDFEMVSRLFASPYNTGYVVDIATGANIYTPTSTSGTEAGGLTVFDLDNDGYPEIFHPGQGGYFDFNPVNSTLNFVSAFPALSSSADKDNAVLDYDLDGDLDFFIFFGFYGTTSLGTLQPTLMRNNGDGTFTDVSSTAFAGITLDNRAFYSSYANSTIGDFNNDGYPDVVYFAEDFNQVTTILINDGDGTFTKDDSHPMVEVNGGCCNNRPWGGVYDYDNDGRVDIVHTGHIVQEGKIGVLYRNTTNSGNNWIRIRARGEGDNTDGLHTRITLFEAGTSNIVGYQHIGVFSHAHQNLIAHSGVGVRSTVDVRIEYPHGGPVCNFSNVATDLDYVAFRTCDLQQYAPGNAIPLTYVAQSNVDTTVTLVADGAVTPTASEQVTFAVPFGDGDVTDLNSIVVSIGGTEQAVAIETLLDYQGGKSGIRAARIQIPSVDMTGGDVVVSVTDTGSSVARTSFAAQTAEFATGIATKDSQPFKRIWPKHDLAYVRDSYLLPPYAINSELDASYSTYAEHQFDGWGEPFDYTTSTQANWQFDRVGTMYKLYLQFGDTKYLKEAFLAFRYYISNIQMTGTVASGRGGWIGDTADEKYIYTEPVLLHYALMGDDTWLTEVGDTVQDMVEDMSTRAIDNSEQGGILTSKYSLAAGYDDQDEFFTERRVGLTLWGASVTCSMYGDPTICNTLNTHIDELKEMQQSPLAFDAVNGWDTKSGGFVHSWVMHECGGCFTDESQVFDDQDADRRFSPWMSAHMQMAFWTSYWMLDSTIISNHTELPEIIRFLSEGVNNFGLDPSPIGSASVSHEFYTSYINTAAGYTFGGMQFCDATGSSPYVLYTTAPFATQAELYNDIPDGGAGSNTAYPDNRSSTHYGEVLGLLAKGLYFETDPTKITNLQNSIAGLSDVYTTACSTWFQGTGVPRALNWQFFTNPRATYDWVEDNI